MNAGCARYRVRVYLEAASAGRRTFLGWTGDSLSNLGGNTS